MKKKEPGEIFSMSFLDIMSCGFGAIVLILLISQFQTDDIIIDEDQIISIQKLEGDIEVAKADLRVFMANPIGVAEHIDYVVTAEKKLEILAHAEELKQKTKLK